jgi:hypothetical protein
MTRGLRQSNNLKTTAKTEKYKMYEMDTSRDKSRDFDLRSKLITYLKTLIEVNPMSMSFHISIFYLRTYIIYHNSQCGYIIIHTQTQIWIEIAMMDW